jgi:hypothetical protein
MEREPIYSKEVEVSGFRYLINHAQVEEAFEIGVELLKLIGGSAAAMAGAGGSEAAAGNALSGAVSSLLQKIHPRESMVLIKRVMRHVEVQGPVSGSSQKMMLDEMGLRKHFHARTGAMLRVLGTVLEFTHQDFFEAIGDGVATLMKKVEDKVA